MRVLRCADAGVLVEVADLREVIALRDAVAARPIPGVTDVVPAARTVLLRLAPGTDPSEVADVVGALPLTPDVENRRGVGATVTVPVHYDGQDLAEVADLTGLSPREVVRAHTGTPWTVAFCGFAPGFGYMVGGDPRLRVPRRDEARVRVPAGAVALAGDFTGVYPRASPGGWRLLGHTELVVWDVDRDPPGLLRPGVRVRFEEAA